MISYENYMEQMQREWKDIFSVDSDFYLYGAALNAKRMLIMAKKTGVISKIKGCLVSSMEGNSEYCEDIKVVSIAELQDRNAVIMLSHMGRHKENIMQLLEQYGFKHIISINKYYELVDWKIKETICDACMDKARQIQKEMFENKSQEDLQNDFDIRQKITDMMQNQKIGFGGQVTYQSFERIGMPGVRPSLYRIKKYGLESILSSTQNVLDIGCNVGFFDMSVADQVHSITGVEYDGNLVRVADLVKNYVGINNCVFVHADFDNWYAENTQKYDVIFSFAIHHWLNLQPQEYVIRINQILNKEGFICIESHVGTDLEYKECLDKLQLEGYRILNQGIIMDDGMREREWCLLQRG